MGFWFIPIRVSTEEIHVQADRRLAFQVLTAWGAAGPDGKRTSKVLEKSGDRLLVEFHTSVNMLFGLKTVQRTVEWVTLDEPGHIDFEGVQGPLPVLLCRWSLEEWGDCLRFKYDATVALHGSILGWIFGILYVRPTLRRMMREHLAELKETIEARAARSRMFPQKPCPAEEGGTHAAEAARVA